MEADRLKGVGAARRIAHRLRHVQPIGNSVKPESVKADEGITNRLGQRKLLQGSSLARRFVERMNLLNF